MMETVIDIIEQDGLLATYRLGALLRETCIVGPVTAVQGAGFLAGLRTAARRRTSRASSSHAAS
jgi:hypothetical protein